MATKTFATEELKALIDDCSDVLGKVSDKITGRGRWSIHYTLVFKDAETGKFYETTYSVGATEQQDEVPFDGTDTVECTEVRPVEKTVVVYEAVPQCRSWDGGVGGWRGTGAATCG